MWSGEKGLAAASWISRLGWWLMKNKVGVAAVVSIEKAENW